MMPRSRATAGTTDPAEVELGRRLSSIARAAFFAGAIAGAATGLIDGLWTWDRLSQFAAGTTKVRALLFLAALYATAGAFAAPIVAVGATIIAQATRIGDIASALHRRAPFARTALAVCIVPALGLLFAVAFLALAPGLENRKHFGLVIAVTLFAALAATIAGVLLGAVFARVLEALFEMTNRWPRIARFLQTQTAALLGLLFGIIFTAGAIAWRAQETVAVLKLRAPTVVFVLVVLAIAVRHPAAELARRLWKRTRFASAIAAAAAGALLLTALFLGDSDAPRKAGVAHSGLAAPLTRVTRAIFDIDRDGHSRVFGGGDCDDWDASKNPGAPEIPDDGIDNNCVGGDVTLARDLTETAFAEPPADLPPDFNVLLITIDTLRADHLGTYGYKRATSPTLDALAADGTVFENGWAHAPSTRYSIPAILTGRLPLSVEYFPIGGGWPGIAAQNDTIAEVLKRRGMVTGAILNYWYFEERRRMNQGFDFYDNTNRILHKGVKGEGPAKTSGTSSKEQTDKAIEFVTARAAERFFLWVHYYDPHFDYERHPGTTEFGSGTVALYDHEIRFTDDQIGRLIADLKARGLYDKTVIVVTGDHGEGFGEHGINLHGYHLYAAQTKVPLIIRVPGAPPSRVTMPAAHIDILPTLANLAGAEPNEDMDGRSLLDVISGSGDRDADRTIFQQLSFENNNEMRGAASKQCHVIFNVSPHRSWETYEIDTDPRESRDRPSSKKCAPTRSALESFYDRSEIPRDALSALLEKRPPIAKPLDIDFGGKATLLALEAPSSVKRGESVPLTLTWEAGAGFDDEWKVFVHLEGTGPAKKAFLQADHEPARPLRWWKRGQVIRYQRPLTIPTSARSGTYNIWVGLFRGKDRHPVSASGKPIADMRARAGVLQINSGTRR